MHLLSPSENLVKVCLCVAGKFQAQLGGKPPCTSAFLVSACIILATVPWPKESRDQSQSPRGRKGTTKPVKSGNWRTCGYLYPASIIGKGNLRLNHKE